MESLTNLILVEGDFLTTFINLFVLIISFDFLISFASAIKSMKGAVS